MRCFCIQWDAGICPAKIGSARPFTWLNVMKPLLFLANAFINTFGITQPTEAAAKRASQFIAVLIGLVLALVLAFVAFGVYILTRH